MTDEPSDGWVTGLSLDVDGLTDGCQVSALSPAASPGGLPDSQMGGLTDGWVTAHSGQLAVVALRHNWAMSGLEALAAAVWWTAQTSGC